MCPTRREFIAASLVAGGVSALPSALSQATTTQPAREASKPIRILILGGTGFIGPYQVRYALSRGHEVTLFNRGKTNPELFPNVEQLRGDRDNDLESLKRRRWDAVIDNSASLPRWVRQSAGLLKDAASTYLFVSSISVYSDNSIVGMDESAPVGVLADTTVEEITGETYGPLKALCEKEAQAAFPEGAIIVRPGLIVGPGDRSDRFTYWPVRVDRGGEILAPGSPEDPVQIIDARDLAEWMIRMVEERASGVYNATGPIRPMLMAEMLYGIRAVTAGDCSFTWVNADFLAQHKVEAWSDMPTWVPPTDGMEGFSRVDCSRALAKGLRFRPLADTARETLEWFKELPAERQAKLRSGIDPEREAQVLAAWHAQNQG